MIHLLMALFVAMSWAQSLSQDQVESKVRADLESTLTKMIDPSQFSLQVSANVQTRSERQMVEGEQITQPRAATADVHVPALPGFDPAPVAAPESPGQMRQVFRTVEKPVLQSVGVTLILGRSVDEAQAKVAQDMARSYLNSSYGNLGHLSVQRANLLVPPGPSLLSHFTDFSAVGWLLAFVLAMGLAWLWSRRRRSTIEAPSRLRDVRELSADSSLPAGERMPFGSDSDLRLGLPVPREKERTAFAGVPANPQYADQRRLLLDAFLQNASVFRVYFQKLDLVARGEICTALKGPAFATLMESLKLSTEESVSQTPSEEQLQFYLKNFSEFQGALQWQEQQFFGFLPNLTPEQLRALVQMHNPVVGALIVKFCRPEVSALVIDRMPESERSQIIDQFERTREIPPEELRTIENNVRASVALLPNFILSSTGQELDYWTQLLAATSDPEKLLTSLQRVRPDLYEKLARFRFKLEDLPSLPTPLIRKVIDEVENDDLARALSAQSMDLMNYLLTQMPSARRQMVESQILSYQNVRNADVQNSVDHLVRRFREVLV